MDNMDKNDIKNIIGSMDKTRPEHPNTGKKGLYLVKGVCQRCKGVGFTRDVVPYGHPNFGKSIPCECTLARQKSQQQVKLENESGILQMTRFKNATFDTFNLQLPGVTDAFMQATEFADHPQGWLVLIGPYGCGKTHLATAIARRRIDAGDTVLVETVPDFLDHLRSTFSANTAETYDERLQQARNADLLGLDDYGAQNDTAWANEKLFQLLNHRYNRELPTVITSNGLQGIDPRVRSRLMDKNLVTLINMDSARDYRSYGDEI